MKECEHDYKNAIRKGRAWYICPDCKKDITIMWYFYHKAKLKTKQ